MGRRATRIQEGTARNRVIVVDTYRGLAVRSKPIFSTPRTGIRALRDRPVGSTSGGSPRKKPRYTQQHASPLQPTNLWDSENVPRDGSTPPRVSPPPFATPRSSRKTYNQHDFMSDWIPLKADFLRTILQGEQRAETVCSTCGDGEALWRCLECIGRMPQCRVCIRNGHKVSPYHRVERWANQHWTSAWLWQTGLVVNLGHGGQPCPSPLGLFDQDEGDWTDEEDEEDAEEGFDSDDFSFGARPKSRVIGDDRIVLVIHTNGVHYLPFHICGCSPRTPEFQQFLSLGLYPASVKTVRTVATFELLDDYHMNKVECHTSTYHYFAKIRRLTNKAFPQTAPNRDRELSRMGRQWIHLKNLKWYGFGHQGRNPGEGELALFCPACPQKGINVPNEVWDDLPDTLTLRSFVADGNFSCVHQRQRGADKDIWITSGTSYKVERTEYAEHVKGSTEVKEASTCHEHRAIADKWKTLKGCDVSGIGSIACMRHGCFVPASTVDFQKGERQINMDYAWLKALKHGRLVGVKWVLLAYDINCQYCVKFTSRVKKYKAVKLPPGLVIVNAIGLWHVHGHRPECYARFAPSFIPGAGRKSGEILEPLWAPINQIAGPTRTMSSSNRDETLDTQMADSNWKKTTGIVAAICKDLPNAKKEAEEALHKYKAICNSVTDDQIKQWSQELTEAQASRLTDFKAMDILNSRIESAPKMKTVEASMMDSERAAGEGYGDTAWLVLGIEIQEKQARLARFIRKHRSYPTDKQTLAIAKDRLELTGLINQFFKDASALFPDVDPADLTLVSPPANRSIVIPDGEGDVVETSDDEGASPDEQWEDGDIFVEDRPEESLLPLPSNVSNWPKHYRSVRRKERQLRVAQANNELEEIRDAIGRLSYLYRSLVRKSKTKKSKTRSYGIVKGSREELKTHVAHYEHARWALTRLRTSEEIMARFQPLRPEDLRVNTAIADPNARGQSSTHLSWIWGVASDNPGDRTAYLDELYRVNWIRAHEKYLRCEEEFQFLVNETSWVPSFFNHKAREWRQLQGDNLEPGHLAYASRQETMWASLSRYARSKFAEVLKELTKAVRDGDSSSGSDTATSSGSDTATLSGSDIATSSGSDGGSTSSGSDSEG